MTGKYCNNSDSHIFMASCNMKCFFSLVSDLILNIHIPNTDNIYASFAISNLVSIPIVVLIASCSTSDQKESFVLARNCIVQLTLLPRNFLNSLIKGA